MKAAVRQVLVLAAVCATGCFQYRLTRNAPGHVDLGAPPPDASRREPEVPDDPGDQGVIVQAGGFVAGGAATGGARSARSSYGLGLEARWLYGQFDRTVFSPFDSALPDRALGMNFGWTPLLEDDQNSRLYLELQGRLRRPYGLALGWNWEAGGNAHGPQTTASFGPLFLRGSYLSGRGTTVLLGIAVEPSFALVWSR